MKEFWDNQAKEYGENCHAVNFDELGEDLELFHLAKIVKDDEIICDLGCGNGRTTLALAQIYKKSQFYGVDFSENMISAANNKKKELAIENVHFLVFNATSETIQNQLNFKFDTILCKRLLINVKGEEKLKIINNITQMLKSKGCYIMAECFLEPLHKINTIRIALGLEAIKVHSFNEYLDEDFLNTISNKFYIESIYEAESLYYFISRIFNARLSDNKPEYNAPINKLAVEITKLGIYPIEGYSPERMIVLRKIQ
jgi:ubiquinone/menaquinone biosynthesis C-methylase UbiE